MKLLQWCGLATPQGRGRWMRGVLWTVVVSITLVVFAPQIVALPPVMSRVLDAAASDLNGSVAVDRASLSWWSQPDVKGIAVNSRNGEPALRIDRVEGTHSLWQMLSNTRQMGEFTITEPEVRLITTDRRLNWVELLPQPRADQPDAPEPETAPELPPVVRQLGAGLRIRNARVLFRGPDSTQDWTIEGINFAAALLPPEQPDARPAIVIEAGPVVQHADLSVGLCGDVLKFVAPVLAGVANARGDISVELAPGHIPLGEPLRMELGGVVSLHEVEAGPGSLIHGLAELLSVPPMIQLASDTHITFAVRDGLVEHNNLEFGLGQLLRVRTHGTVGFDESIDISAEVRLYVESAGESVRPLLRAVNDQPLRMRVTGTLRKPRFETTELAESGVELLLGMMQELTGDEPRDDATGGAADPATSTTALLQTLQRSGLMNQLRQRVEPSATADDAPPAGPVLIAPEGEPAVSGERPGEKDKVDQAIDVATSAVQLLQDLLRQRRERQRPLPPPADPSQADEPAAPQTTAPPADPPERRRPFSRLRDRLRRPPPADEQPPPASP